MSLNKSKSLRTAEKYVLQGKIPAAIDEYRKVVDADPADLTTINTLGDLYVRAGKIQEAINNFSRIAESYRESGFTLKAIAMLKKISKLDPTNVETSMKLANLYSQQGLLVEARQQYLQVADSYARAGQTRKALEAYQKIADLDPSNTSVRMKLGEIYSREAMMDQSHEAFLTAGAEFLRKGDMEQALNANLKAISINPESRQGLTAIATIYTQMGQADRAINILCDAFESNPGDVELLTILGRTYLSAGLMDEAERTFLSLVELDRNRYHYLLEVGRKFLEMGELDRSAEQIDGCLDVLIAKREEDKAIDFLRRVLDRDMNHIGSLKRMGQIFLRIREDHNLIATLNSLVEASMRKGEDSEAIQALKELVRLEPDEPMHRQRLYNLGVQDIVEGDSPDVVRATGPLDFQSAAFDDTFVIRQISEAEILAGHGQVEHAVSILREILNHAPENVQVHLKLKDIYLRAGIIDNAATECVELARIHEARGESARAGDFLAEARQLNPLIDESFLAPDDMGSFHSDEHDNSFIEELHREESDEQESEGFDLASYQTGALGSGSFVTVPEEAAHSNGHAGGDFNRDNGLNSAGNQVFRYSDTLIGGRDETGDGASMIADMVFNSTGNLPSDTMTRVLHDELEGVDFYIAQGYLEIAEDTLDRLREEHGDHPEILARYKKFRVTPVQSETFEEYDVEEATQEASEPLSDQTNPGAFQLQPSAGEEGVEGFNSFDQQVAVALEDELDEEPGGFEISIPRSPVEGERRNFAPMMIHKESGQLDQDLLVQLNTSELVNSVLPNPNDPGSKPALNTGDLLDDTIFDPMRPATGGLPQIAQTPLLTGDLMEAIVSDFDSSFDALKQSSDAPASADAEPADDGLQVSEQVEEVVETRKPGETTEAGEVEGAEIRGDELQEIFEELSENSTEIESPLDYETHYSLGLAYKDMDLFDEAIEQFQHAFRLARIEEAHANYMQCCHMLGVCFNRKEMPKVAIMWFQRGLRAPGRTEDEYQAMRYEVGLCHEAIGDIDKALDVFSEVYGIDVNYRFAGDKIKQLQSSKDA